MRKKSKRSKPQQPWTRARAAQAVRRMLARDAWPRLEMSAVLILAAASGFGASVLLLQLGITQMGLRYPVAVVFAYGVFLVLLRVWIALRNPFSRLDVEVLDIDLDLSDLRLRLPTRGVKRGWFGGGGDFGGSGATDAFGGAGRRGASNLAVSMPPAPSGGSGGGGGSWFDFDIDLEMVAVVIAALLVLTAVIACGYVIYSAPVLLAEILLDSLVVAGFYKGIPREGGRYWLKAAIKGTWIPMVLVTVFLALAGFVLQLGFPEAQSIGDVWRGIGGE